MKISKFNTQIQKKIENIAPERKSILHNIARKIITTFYGDGQCNVLFVCTHNSRRSQASQLLFNHFIQSCHLEIKAFSAGTEATCFNQSMIHAASYFGFDLTTDKESLNPIYELQNQPYQDSMQYFSKVVDHKINPKKSTVAIMVCNDADKNCPIISSANYRLPLPFQDPKSSDGKQHEAATYQASFVEIGAEMLYLVNYLNAHK